MMTMTMMTMTMMMLIIVPAPKTAIIFVSIVGDVPVFVGKLGLLTAPEVIHKINTITNRKLRFSHVVYGRPFWF